MACFLEGRMITLRLEESLLIIVTAIDLPIILVRIHETGIIPVFYLLLYLQHLKLCVAHKWQSVNICSMNVPDIGVMSCHNFFKSPKQPCEGIIIVAILISLMAKLSILNGLFKRN